MQSFFKRIMRPGESLEWRTIQGFVVVLSGNAYQNGIRLVGNLIMARLLYPEAFGLMLIVNLVFTALTMLSDAGIKQAIIVQGRGRGAEYLNTAWTLLCLRGAALSVVACLLAWPVSLAYDKPILFELIIVMSLASLIRGFSSPNEAIYDREVKQARSVFLEALSQTVGLTCAVLWLFAYPTIWALVGYGIISSAVYTVMSYKLFHGQRPSFCFDKKVVREIVSFGKWILLSTALTFMASQGDKLLISNWLTTTELGIFSIAIALAKVAESVSGAICWKLLLPVYAELREGASERLTRQAMKSELILFAICAPFLVAFTVFGNELIDIMYDDRYQNAGWMLQAMAVGTIFAVYNETFIAMMIAHTHSYRATVFQFCRVCLLIITMTIGGYGWGTVGLVYSISIAPALFYVLLLFNMRRYNVNPKVELATIAAILVTVITAWSFRGWPGLSYLAN